MSTPVNFIDDYVKLLFFGIENEMLVPLNMLKTKKYSLSAKAHQLIRYGTLPGMMLSVLGFPLYRVKWFLDFQSLGNISVYSSTRLTVQLPPLLTVRYAKGVQRIEPEFDIVELENIKLATAVCRLR